MSTAITRADAKPTPSATHATSSNQCGAMPVHAIRCPRCAHHSMNPSTMRVSPLWRMPRRRLGAPALPSEARRSRRSDTLVSAPVDAEPANLAAELYLEELDEGLADDLRERLAELERA